MADEIRQQLGFDASGALDTLKQLDSALAQLEARLGSTGSAVSKFNQAGNAFDNVGKSSKSAAATVAQSTNSIISSNERLTVSWGLLSRVVTTQAIVSVFRMLKNATISAVNDAIRFETALARIQTIADGSFGSLDQLGKSVTEFSQRLNVGLDDAAAALQNVVSSQVAKGQAALDFLETATLLARGLGVTTEQTSTLLTGSLNAFGKSSADANRFASIFFATVDKGTITAAELVSSFNKVSGRALAAGVSVEELAAAFIVLTKNGKNGAISATEISGIISAFTKPSEAMQKALRQLGADSGETLIKQRGLAGAMQAVIGTTDGSSASINLLAKNIRGASGLLALGKQHTDDFTQSVALLNNTASDLAASKGLEVMSTDAQTVARDMNLVSIAWTKFGQAAAHVAANNIRFLQGVEQDLGAAKLTAHVKAVNEQLLKNQETADGNRIKLASASLEGISKIQLQEVEAIRKAGSLSLSAAQTAIQNLVNARQQGIDQLKHQAPTLRSVLLDSPTQHVQVRQSRRDFDTRTQDLNDAEKASLLIRRASDQASEAASALATAAQTGNKHAIDHARQLFEAAQATGDEARNLAQSAGDRDLANQAARRLKDITDQQLSSEANLNRVARERLPILNQQIAAQEANLKVVQAALKDLSKNSTVFGSDNNPLSPEALKQQATARADALKRLSAAGVDNSTLVKIQFDTEQGIRDMQAKLKSSSDRFRVQVPIVADLEKTLGKQQGSITTAAGVTNALIEAQQKAVQLRQTIADLSTSEGKVKALKQSIASTPQLIAEDQPNTVRNFNAIKQQIIDLSKTGAIADEQVAKLEASIAAIGGGPGADALQAALDKLKQLQTVQTQIGQSPAATGQAQQQLQQLDTLLRQADPSAPFATIQGSIQAAIAPAASLADQMERAARAALQLSTTPVQAHAFGGPIGHFAAGGRGVDTIPAMLSAGEFVVNARSAGRFFSQLQAINAGQNPNFRAGGGIVNSNNVGDVSVNIKTADASQIDGRKIGRELRREIRRGNLRI